MKKTVENKNNKKSKKNVTLNVMKINFQIIQPS